MRAVVKERVFNAIFYLFCVMSRKFLSSRSKQKILSKKKAFLRVKKKISRKKRKQRVSKQTKWAINENLEYGESELRLIIYQIGIGMAMHLAIIAILVSIPIISMENKPIIVMPNIVDYNQYGE